MRLSFALVAVSVVACRTADPAIDPAPSAPVIVAPVTMSADASSYAPGARVTLRIENHTQDQVGFNPCTRSIERHTGGQSWELYTEAQRMCTMELWTLDPRMTRSATTDLPSNLQPGTYRLTLVFSPQRSTPSGTTTGIRASTSPFTVR